MVTYLGALVQLCCGEGGTLPTSITGMCGSAHSVWTTLGLPQLKAACASWVYSAQAPGFPAGALSKAGRCFVRFPGLSCKSSGSQVFYKGTDSAGPAFCALPRSEELRQPGAWRAHCPRWAVSLNHLPGPSHSVSWVHHKSAISGVPCVSSGELISGCHPPGECQPFRFPGRHC